MWILCKRTNNTKAYKDYSHLISAHMHQIIHVLCLFLHIFKKHAWCIFGVNSNFLKICPAAPWEFHENLLFNHLSGETISCYCLPTHFPFSNLTEGSSAVRSQSFRQHVRKVAILHCTTSSFSPLCVLQFYHILPHKEHVRKVLNGTLYCMV